MRRGLLTAAVLAAVLGGCGTPGADLLIVHRTGTIPGAGLELRVLDDGQAICNGTTHELPSRMLIDARVAVRDLADPAKAGLRLPPGPGAILRFDVRSEDGTVAFSDTSRGQPRVFYRVALLVRRIAMGPCGLPR